MPAHTAVQAAVEPGSLGALPPETLTVYHCDSAVFHHLAGHAGRLHLDGHQVPLMGHEHHDVEERFLFLQLSGKLNFLSVHFPTFNAIPVKVRVRRDPRAGDGCGVLRPAVQVLNLVRLYRTERDRHVTTLGDTLFFFSSFPLCPMCSEIYNSNSQDLFGLLFKEKKILRDLLRNCCIPDHTLRTINN